MPTFKYKAYDAQGHFVESIEEAPSAEDLKKSLISKGYMVANVTQKTESIDITLGLKSKKLTLDSMEFLTSELSILLDSGVKIDKGLGIVARGKKDPVTSRVVSEILRKLKAGNSVADSFETTKNDFDPLYLNLISIGEKSGTLPSVFSGLAADLKFQRSLRSKIIHALTYPSIIFFVCIVCVLFVFNYIVPQMGSIFDVEDDLPIYTEILLQSSEWMIKYQMWLLGVGAIALFLFSYKWQSLTFRNRVAKYALTLPFVAELINQIERIRFNSAMALMLDAGVKVDTAIGSALANVQNPVIRNSLKIANEKIKKGASLTQSLAMTSVYPAFYVSLLEVGEESGELSRIFKEIANRSKADFEAWTDRVTNILEPLLILVMGGIVGSVVITMLLSVVSVNDISI